MKNYAEELAYWYLRFNGFFVIENFVLHKNGLEPTHQNADMDILAIRMQHAYELVGSRPDDQHNALFQYFEPDRQIGLLCEVKSNWNGSEVLLTRRDRLLYGVRRMGFFDEAASERCVDHLEKKAVFEDQNCQVAKLFICDRGGPQPHFINITIDQVTNFILEHLEKYREWKQPAWNHFPSNLIQYLILVRSERN